MLGLGVDNSAAQALLRETAIIQQQMVDQQMAVRNKQMVQVKE